LTAGDTGLAFSAAAGVYITVSAVVVRLGRRATTMRCVAVGTLALALFTVPAMFGPGAAGLVGVLMLSTAPRAVVGTICLPLAAEAADGVGVGVGLVIGLLNVAWAIGNVVAPLIAGGVDQLAGPEAAYLAAVLPGAAVALWLLLRLRSTPVTTDAKKVPVSA
jgi:MFS family permease